MDDVLDLTVQRAQESSQVEQLLKMEFFDLKFDPHLKILRSLVEAYQAIFQGGIGIFTLWA